MKRVRLTPKAANDYVAQVEHWKAEAMWAASFIVSLFKAAWEADQSSTYQRARAILKEAGE